MIFDEILGNIQGESDDCIAVVLMGFDGIPIASIPNETPGVDVQSLAIESIKVIKDLAQLNDAVELGTVDEFSLSAGNYKVIFRLISDEYFLVLLLKSDGNLGKGRYLLNKYQSHIRQEL